MTKKEFSKVLRLYYSEPMVKALRTNNARPSYEKMCVFYEKHKIPFLAWRDIRAWLESKKNEPKNDL